MGTAAARRVLGFFSRHLNGEYTLARAYWGHLTLGQIVFAAGAMLLLPWLGETFPARYAAIATIALVLCGYLLWAWAAAGAWASASRHVGRGGSRGWATTAKVVILLGALHVFLEVPTGVNAMDEHWDVANGAQVGPQSTVRLGPGGKALLLDGGINYGTAEWLEAELANLPTVTTVVLQSNGGRAREGELIGRVITARGLNTHVEDECSSACTIAFLAGKVRSAQPGAKLGFHAFGTVGGQQTDTATVEETYARAGLNPAFIAKIMATPPATIWYPGQEELLAEGVLTQEPGTGVEPDQHLALKNP